MEDWLLFSLVTMVLWGIWGFLPKLAIEHISPESALFYEAIGGLIVGLVVLGYFLGFKPEIKTEGVVFATVTGIAALAGALLFLFAVQKERYQLLLW